MFIRLEFMASDFWLGDDFGDKVWISSIRDWVDSFCAVVSKAEDERAAAAKRACNEIFLEEQPAIWHLRRLRRGELEPPMICQDITWKVMRLITDRTPD